MKVSEEAGFKLRLVDNEEKPALGRKAKGDSMKGKLEIEGPKVASLRGRRPLCLELLR